MTISRRRFLKVSGVTAIGAAAFGTVPLVVWLRGSTVTANAGAVPANYTPEANRWAMVIKISDCIGCRRCLNACKQENHVPHELELNRTWLEKYDVNLDGGLDVKFISRTDLAPELDQEKSFKGFYVPKLCNQCANPPCVSVCPVNATFKTPDGVILVDHERCIGCKYCIVACPYGARYLHPETKVVDKCTFCYHRITYGLRPACVEACPTGARAFGNLKDPNDPIGQRIIDEALQVIKPSLGTKPVVFYNGLRDGVK